MWVIWMQFETMFNMNRMSSLSLSLFHSLAAFCENCFKWTANHQSMLLKSDFNRLCDEVSIKVEQHIVLPWRLANLKKLNFNFILIKPEVNLYSIWLLLRKRNAGVCMLNCFKTTYLHISEWIRAAVRIWCKCVSLALISGKNQGEMHCNLVLFSCCCWWSSKEE